MRLTVEQIQRLQGIVEAWNEIRGSDRRRATVGEVIDYMIQQEEIGIEAMTAAEMKEELSREDLADSEEKPLPAIVVTPSWQKADPEDFDNDTNRPLSVEPSVFDDCHPADGFYLGH